MSLIKEVTTRRSKEAGEIPVGVVDHEPPERRSALHAAQLGKGSLYLGRLSIDRELERLESLEGWKVAVSGLLKLPSVAVPLYMFGQYWHTTSSDSADRLTPSRLKDLAETASRNGWPGNGNGIEEGVYGNIHEIWTRCHEDIKVAMCMVHYVD